MKSFNSKYFTQFKQSVLSHNLSSGEIIIEIWEHDKSRFQSQTLFDEMISISNIKREGEKYELTEITYAEAIKSMKYGMSVKTNYTEIDKQFTVSNQNQYAYEFLNFFENCKCYTTKSRLYKSNLDLNNFWETGGVIAVDNNKIGLFWVNDLYG